MDKNTIIGFVLIFGIIVGFSWFNRPTEEQIAEQKSAIVREIVDNMPEPCNNILWGYYRDGFSMKTMAEMFDYSSESSVKVTKHRCCDKFKKRYTELSRKLF